LTTTPLEIVEDDSKEFKKPILAENAIDNSWNYLIKKVPKFIN